MQSRPAKSFRRGLISITAVLCAAGAGLAQSPNGPELLLPEPTPFGAPPPPGPDRSPAAEPLPAPRPVPGIGPGGVPTAPPGLPGPGPGRLEIPLPASGPTQTRIFSIDPRYSSGFQAKFHTLPDKTDAVVLTGGVIFTVRVAETGETVDIEADQAVVWTNSNVQEFLDEARSGRRQAKDQELEFYLTGNVEVRIRKGINPLAPAFPPPREEYEPNALRAKEVYYDAKRNRAIAIDFDMGVSQPRQIEAAHLRGAELWQLSRDQFRAHDTAVFSSRLPSDPGLALFLRQADIRQDVVPVRNLLMQPYRNPDGSTVTEVETTFEGRHSFLEVNGVPVFYLPYARGNVEDPLGPLEAIAFRADQVFGQQILTSWDMFELLRIRRRNTQNFSIRWLGHADYLSDRGPGGGTSVDYRGLQMFGVPTRYSGYFLGYGLYDEGRDQLGGLRSELVEPGQARGRVLYRHVQDLPQFGLSFQGQFSYLSDVNFLEQYYKIEFDHAPNNETFGYLKWQDRNLAATILAQPNIRDWVNETQWLPLGEVHWLGNSFFDRLTYNAWGSAGYADVNTVNNPDRYRNPPPLLPTEVELQTTRLNLSQELALPLEAGPFKVVPYARLDLTYYSRDLLGEELGRVYGGGGVRASIPFTRLYPGVSSDLFNLKGLNHKVTFGTNYYIADANENYDMTVGNAFADPYTRIPMLDRLNDDAVDRSLRDIRAIYAEPSLYPNIADTLLTSGVFNPQFYAIRRLVDSRVDTLDEIQVVQFDVRQRLQTKRGYPGLEHTLDWMRFDFSTSFFPDSVRDNFGEPIAFSEYDAVWNVGDQTGLFSSGWLDPFDTGARYFSAGVNYTRGSAPGLIETFLTLGYRHIDPLESRAVIAAITYRFSPKYMLTASTVYDFGIQEALSNSLIFSRSGTDVTLSFGLNYNAIIQNFGFTFQIVPNIVAATSGNQFGPRTQVFGSR